jgi:hypothetical protein
VVIQYSRYSICSANNLDLERGYILIPTDESLARTICNLSRWSVKLLFVIFSINQSSRYHICLNIFHFLDKLCRVNVNDSVYLNLVTYRLNTLSGEPLS